MKLYLKATGCHLPYGITCNPTQVNTSRLNPSQRPVVDHIIGYHSSSSWACVVVLSGFDIVLQGSVRVHLVTSSVGPMWSAGFIIIRTFLLAVMVHWRLNSTSTRRDTNCQYIVTNVCLLDTFCLLKTPCLSSFQSGQHHRRSLMWDLDLDLGMDLQSHIVMAWCRY